MIRLRWIAACLSLFVGALYFGDWCAEQRELQARHRGYVEGHRAADESIENRGGYSPEVVRRARDFIERNH